MAGMMAMPVNMAKILAAQLAAQTADINANTDSKTNTVITSVDTKAGETQAAVNTVGQTVGTETQEIDTKLSSMTTVGGQLDTNVTAINNHVTSELATKTVADSANKDEVKTHVSNEMAALSLSPIKSIQRGSVTLSYAQDRVHVVISAVDMAKSTISVSCASGFTTKGGNNNAAYGFNAGAYFSGTTGVYVQAGGDDASGFHTPCIAYWEVIEYV